MAITGGRLWFFKRIRFPKSIIFPLIGSGAPTSGTSGTGANVAGPGSMYIDFASGTYYVNTNTKASPTWTAGGALSGAITPSTVAATGAITTSGATASSGYATGAGGAVTQITNSGTAVTLNKPCGQITTVALTTAAGAEERFTVNNTMVLATDVIALSTTYNGGGTPSLSVCKVAANAFDIVITNLHSANAFDAAMVINFVVHKSVAA